MPLWRKGKAQNSTQYPKRTGFCSLAKAGWPSCRSQVAAGLFILTRRKMWGKLGEKRAGSNGKSAREREFFESAHSVKGIEFFEN
jgi:hypothetical protein